MVFPKARVIVSAALFVGWILFLAYLAAITREPVVVSRPQIMVASVCVVATLEEHDGQPKPEVHVTEVLWSADGDKALVGQKLILSDLADLGRPQGWTGSGNYLLALTRHKSVANVGYELTPVPPMPGFHPTVTLELADAGPNADAVARHLQQAFDLGPQRAKSLAEKGGAIKHFLTAESAIRLKNDLEDAGARVHLQEYETRIYRATDDVLRQFHTLK